MTQMNVAADVAALARFPTAPVAIAATAVSDNASGCKEVSAAVVTHEQAREVAGLRQAAWRALTDAGAIAARQFSLTGGAGMMSSFFPELGGPESDCAGKRLPYKRSGAAARKLPSGPGRVKQDSPAG